ncbi:hypothetical protein B0H98_1235 [Vreelandella songnenensis]|uniref:Uncharacterized protein n=1 Tax=Vreelandella songnenensis TaxID=1176243 RepID=A0A2T0UIB1_9GAMM|nr:hypothetical protein [Halomonas songnenensis]PRY57577.1 hypothetical protein B0H98_1235 [Halomonas songnenensis]
MLPLDHITRPVVAVAGAVELAEAVIGKGLLAVQAVTGGVYRVAVGLVAVLAAGESAGGIVAVGNDFGLLALQGAEAHSAQGVVLVPLAAVCLRAAQGEVIQLAEVRITALQDQRLGLVATAEADAALSFAVQGIRC